MTEKIINGDLSCDNCPEYHKKRCKEQQEKSDNTIKYIISDIVDTAAVCGCDIKNKTEYLWQQIPRVTRCDVVLEKQLKQTEREGLILMNKKNRIEEAYNTLQMLYDGKNTQYNQLKHEYEKYKNCLDEIKNINKDLLNDLCDNCGWHNTDGCDPDEDYVCGSLIKIKQIISEVENETETYKKF